MLWVKSGMQYLEYPDIAEMISHYLISYVFPAKEIENAFQCAATKEALKVVITF